MNSDANMSFEEIQNKIQEIPDEVFLHLQATMPWQPGILHDAKTTDADGCPIGSADLKDDDSGSREFLQTECWRMFNKNPQVSTSVRGVAGRITGMGFEPTSEIWAIQQVLKDIEYDPRNRLYHYWPKYVVRAIIEGELFLILTCHTDGFVEVDFLDPSQLDTKGDENSGIIFHPTKKLFPLFYCIRSKDSTGQEYTQQIPSINIARYPNLVNALNGNRWFNSVETKASRHSDQKFKKTGGYNRFIVSWDRGFLTRRAVSYLRTVLEWLNHYETLKKYEIDHKKSCGAYAWTFTFEDVKAFKLWVSLSEEERKKTALMQPIIPGSKLFVPPGMKLEAKSPQLPKISGQDTDIMEMAISGLNESADVTTGTVKGTYASVKATRGPMSDRTSDEIADFDRFYRHDFWGSVFYLKSALSEFPEYFEIEEAVGFKNREPIFKMMKRKPQFLVDVRYPISETVDLESRIKALFGVKHGPLPESLGISPSETAKMAGIRGYGRNRLKKATEDKKYPKLIYADGMDPEVKQEKTEGELTKKKKEAQNAQKD